MAMVPLAVLPMTMLPETVEQSESWLASAWELTVTVGWEQMVEVWAGKRLMSAQALLCSHIAQYRVFLLRRHPLAMN